MFLDLSVLRLRGAGGGAGGRYTRISSQGSYSRPAMPKGGSQTASCPIHCHYLCVLPFHPEQCQLPLVLMQSLSTGTPLAPLVIRFQNRCHANPMPPQDFWLATMKIMNCNLHKSHSQMTEWLSIIYLFWFVSFYFANSLILCHFLCWSFCKAIFFLSIGRHFTYGWVIYVFWKAIMGILY